MNLLTKVCATLFTVLAIAQDVNAQKESKELIELNKAFHKNSQARAEVFFDSWRKQIPRINEVEFNSLTRDQREIYEVFESFYDEKFKDDPVKYFLIPNDFMYAILPSLNPDSIVRLIVASTPESMLKGLGSGKFSRSDPRAFGVYFDLIFCEGIKNFRPRMEKAIYLTLNYYDLLGRFLEKSPHDRSVGHKDEFLSSFVRVGYGPWGGWSFERVSKIILDKNFDNGYVVLSGVTSREVIVVKKEKGKWTIVGTDNFSLE